MINEFIYMKDFCEFMEEDKKQQELNEKELKECFEFLEKMKKILEESKTVNEGKKQEFTDEQIQEMVEKLVNGEKVDEGFWGAVGGATVGPAFGSAICRALGINESGLLGKLLTSRIFLTALGAMG